MTQYEMTENLSEKCNVSMEEARAALEAGNWNPLTAGQRLEQEKVRRMQELEEVSSASQVTADETAADSIAADEPSAPDEPYAEAQIPAAESNGTRKRGQGLRRLGALIRRLVACGNRNRLVIVRGGEQLMELPVIALALLMLCAFWVCVPLLVIGLFAGCRYSFAGRDLGRENINRGLDKVAEAAEQVKKAVAEA